MTINKPKVPKGLSYIIKSSQIQELFEELKLDIDISVNYLVSKGGRRELGYLNVAIGFQI